MERLSVVGGFISDNWLWFYLIGVFVSSIYLVPGLIRYRRHLRAVKDARNRPEERNSVNVGGGCNDGDIYKKFLESVHHQIAVYFATDRNRESKGHERGWYGRERDALHFGKCVVSIPHDHKVGELESPRLWKLEFKENPQKHVTVLEVAECSKSIFFESINEVEQDESASKAFIFVHGYNVSFEDAARRTAQIAFDLKFKGVPMFYSWPSAGTVGSYTVDEQNVEWTQKNLASFLVDFLTESRIDKLYIIAHSMGNRAMVRVVNSVLTEFPSFRKRVSEIILAAPDIDAQVFKEQIAPSLIAVGSPVTLYSSSKDKALLASRAVHGHPRAGDSGRDLIVIPGIETIDATKVDTSFMGHSYFAANRSILSDIFYLTTQSQRACSRFGLVEKRHPNGKYWVFIK